MPKKGEKILTKKQVKVLGLDKVSVITADMLNGFTHIGNYAFWCCTGLTSVIIPNSVTSIGDYAFPGCSSLRSVTMPDSVTSIGDEAFYDCYSLTSIEIPNSVTSIGNSAFYNCEKLTSVVVPNSVKSIGRYAFARCTGLSSMTIPNSVTYVGEGVFYDCISLPSVTIGDKIYENQTVADSKCKAYKGFNNDMICRDFQYEEGKTYEFEGKPKLCACGFHACLNLADVFNYYYKKIGKNFVVHEVELEDVTDERHEFDSKVVAKKITIGKRIL